MHLFFIYLKNVCPYVTISPPIHGLAPRIYPSDCSTAVDVVQLAPSIV